MVFYEDFIKKIGKSSLDNLKEKDKFFLELKRIIMWMGTGIPILLISLYQFYVGTLNGVKVTNLIFGAIFLYVALKHIRTVVGYSVELNLSSQILKYEKTEVDLSQVESCTLKELQIGKKSEIQVVIDIITQDKKQYIIPLMMGRKMEFVLMLKKLLGEKFKIQK
ncbi:MAG: hypothetical protein ACRCU6_03400 [Fusobacteriaceae bacterium]